MKGTTDTLGASSTPRCLRFQAQRVFSNQPLSGSTQPHSARNFFNVSTAFARPLGTPPPPLPHSDPRACRMQRAAEASASQRRLFIKREHLRHAPGSLACLERTHLPCTAPPRRKNCEYRILCTSPTPPRCMACTAMGPAAVNICPLLAPTPDTRPTSADASPHRFRTP
jgi:hypothetical protein